MKTVSFPFERQRSTVFGSVYRPVAAVRLWSRRRRQWLAVRMIVDSGADYSLLPLSYVEALGIDLETECRRVTSKGIGGIEIVHMFTGLPLHLGPWSRRVPVGFVGHDEIPPLLGRAGCLDTFDVRFARRRTIFRSLRP